MWGSSVVAAYEVVLGPAARRAVLSLRTDKDKAELADSLRQELYRGPNASKEYRFDSALEGGKEYTATPLSFDGYTTVHRRLTAAELRRLRREQGHPVARIGFYVLDILPPESGVNRRRPLLV